MAVSSGQRTYDTAGAAAPSGARAEGGSRWIRPSSRPCRPGMRWTSRRSSLGGPMLGGEVVSQVQVQVALSMVNRHGLIAGATGTGKTKTLQLMAGQLSDAGVPVLHQRHQGRRDRASPRRATRPTRRLQARVASLGMTFQPEGHPVEFLSLSGQLGAQVRATVHSFGPLLLSKVLELNDTQTSRPDAGLQVLRRQPAAAARPGRPAHDAAVPGVRRRQGGPGRVRRHVGRPRWACCCGRSSCSSRRAPRQFFGEPEFDVIDLMRTTPDGKGIVSVLELSDVMDSPRCSARSCCGCWPSCTTCCPRWATCPSPSWCFFFDEAHLLFDDASKALLDEIEQTVRLIRSKGVGVYFSTQAPDRRARRRSWPSSATASQHALRAFTPDDADALRKAARTFPSSPFYEVEQVITSLGIGEALVTVLSPRGVPTPLAATRLQPPDSLMGGPRRRRPFQGLVASRLAARQVRHHGGPPERPRDHHRPHPAGAGRGRSPAGGSDDDGVAPTAAPTYAQGVQAERARQAAIRAQQARQARAEQAAGEGRRQGAGGGRTRSASDRSTRASGRRAGS